MKLLIQRVLFSSVVINNKEKRDAKAGLLVYLGIKKGDDIQKIDKAVSKLLKLRFFENQEGKLKLSIKDIDGSIMLIPNFTLYANADKGTTLSFDDSANFEEAKPFYDKFLDKLKLEYENVVSGEFRTNMDITALATGPVNVILEF